MSPLFTCSWLDLFGATAATPRFGGLDCDRHWRQARVLVVDDSEVSCEIARYSLTTLGYQEVIICDNAHSALEASDPGALGREEEERGQSARRPSYMQSSGPERTPQRHRHPPRLTTPTVVHRRCSGRWRRRSE